jgi:hypothetical protein
MSMVGSHEKAGSAVSDAAPFLAVERIAKSFDATPVLHDVGLEVERGRIVITPSFDYMERAWDEAKCGRPSSRTFTHFIIQSATDPTLAPAGHHTVSLWTAPPATTRPWRCWLISARARSAGARPRPYEISNSAKLARSAKCRRTTARRVTAALGGSRHEMATNSHGRRSACGGRDRAGDHWGRPPPAGSNHVRTNEISRD